MIQQASPASHNESDKCKVEFRVWQFELSSNDALKEVLETRNIGLVAPLFSHHF